MARTENLILRFTPHIPKRAHATGWTPDRQIAFIAALARTGVVSAAARSVGMSTSSAYQLRLTVRARWSNHSDIPMTQRELTLLGPGYVYSFAAAWDLALEHGLRLQIEAALPVVLEGEDEPIIRRGQIIGWRRKFNTRLAIAACGAYRRLEEGELYDHELRTEERMLTYLEKIEALLRLGPVHWPEVPPAESREERLARQRREREEELRYGKRYFGLLDAHGPPDGPPRTLAARAADPQSYDDWVIRRGAAK